MTMLLSSCKKFLAEYSQDEMRPGATEDLTALMYSEAYPYTSLTETFDVLTDDVQNNPLVVVNGVSPAGYLPILQSATPMFTFDPTMFDENNVLLDGSNVYSNIYVKIKGCNVVMDNLENVKGTDTDKNAILGQCLFLRSYYYFKLVTIYAQMYNAPGVNPEKDLGVPLILSSQVKDGGVPRNTLKEVYDQIEKDLISSEDLLRKNYTPPNVFRIGSNVANALLSRFYLYRGLDEDMDKSIVYASRTLESKSVLTVLANLLPSSGTIPPNGIYNSSSPEMIWISSTNSYSNIFNVSIGTSIPPFTVSSDLLLQYYLGTGTSNYGDLRYLYYFQSFNISGAKFVFRTAKTQQTPPMEARDLG